MKKPDNPMPPQQYTPSYKDAGLIAQRGRLIEVRAPDPDSPYGWPRIWLTPEAAEHLRGWLGEAIRVAQGDEREDKTA